MKKKENLAVRLNKSFRRNDVRAIYPDYLDEEIAYKIGRAVARFLKTKRFIVGRDMRVSSPTLKKFFVKGLVEEGVEVIDIGLCSTPMLYFVSIYMKLPGGMITASHNPKEYNGIKLVRKNAKPIGSNSGLKKIKEIILRNFDVKIKTDKIKRGGKIIKRNLYKEYRKYALSFIESKKLKKGMRVVVDAGSGMAGKLVPLVYSGLPVKVIRQDFKLDGNFPIHDANPLKRDSLKHLSDRIKNENKKSKKVDFGMAFDADMDRIIFVDEKGRPVTASELASLIIENEFRGRNVVYSSVCGNIIRDTIKKVGGKGFLEKVGHSGIKKKMKMKDAYFGCEHSGHYYYKENHYADSGIITSLLVCEIFSQKGESFSELVNEYRKYFKSDEKSIKMKKEIQIGKVFLKIENYYKKFRPKKVSKFDGLRMDFDDFWFSVRKSGTENALRINLEADSKERMKKERDRLMKVVGRGY